LDGLSLLVSVFSTAAAAPPEATGVVVISAAARNAEDLRLGRIASRFANRGLDGFVASDLARPPPDPEAGLVHGRWRLDNARKARRLKRYAAAASAADEAIRAIEVNAFAREHLDLLVEALIERGATAIETGDAATAETVFLKALALSPLYEIDAELFSPNVQQIFSDVRRASRELRYGSIRIEVARMTGATVAIDFGTPQDAPFTTNLPDGRHYVSIAAPSRHEVVAFVPVRAERETAVHIRPPLSGDVRERAAILASFRADDPHARSELARVSGVRFVVTASVGQSAIALTMFDGRTGQPIVGGQATLSLEPSPDEIDAAVARLVESAAVVEPKVKPNDDGPSWYTTWWGLSLIGAAAVGAAAATYLIVQGNAKTTYSFTQ
jgi:hypothetical protein